MFVQGLHLTAAISAVGTIGLAVFVAVLLRRVRVGSETEEQQGVAPAATDTAAGLVMEVAIEP